MSEASEDAQSVNWPAELRRALDKVFSEEDIEVLCFDLGVDYDNLSGEVKSTKIVSLIRVMARTGRIEELIDRCMEARPNVPWDSIRDAAASQPLVAELDAELAEVEEERPPKPDLAEPETEERAGFRIPLWIAVLVVILGGVAVLLLGISLFIFGDGDDTPVPPTTAPPVAGVTETPTSTPQTTATPTHTPRATPSPTEPSLVLDPEDCLSYNPANLRIEDEGAGGWLLTDGRSRMLMLDNETDANRALALAQRHTAHCFIGRGNSRQNRKQYIVEYWMGDSGRATNIEQPDCLSYSRANLRIVDEGASGWLLTDGRSRMLVLDNEQDAENALALAQYHTAHCFIGRGNSRPNRIDYIVEYWE